MRATPRRAILEVRGGPLSARKAVLSPGQTVRVGRSNLADLAIPSDPQMSAGHLAITWDGERCHVRDLDSAKGTWLREVRIREAHITNGAYLRAGNTYLMVYFEAHSPPRASAPAPIDETLLALHFFDQTENLYAIVDASRAARPLQLLHEAVDEHRSLYDGRKGETLADVAPYLVSFRKDSRLIERLVREGWGAGWGIYLSCSRPFKEVRRHLRRFLMVEDDDTGEKYYLRFYDPKVLRVLVPTLTPRQRAGFFGDVDIFYAEGDRGEICQFSREAHLS